jgi:hypothetical protein
VARLTGRGMAPVPETVGGVLLTHVVTGSDVTRRVDMAANSAWPSGGRLAFAANKGGARIVPQGMDGIGQGVSSDVGVRRLRRRPLSCVNGRFDTRCLHGMEFVRLDKTMSRLAM